MDEARIDADAGPIQSVSTSRPKLVVPLVDHETLDGLEPDFERLWALCDEYETTGFYPFTLRTRNSETDAEARQFPRRAGYEEDPATSMAACALGAYLARHAGAGEGWRDFRIEQGRAMGRPGVLVARMLLGPNGIERTRIEGSATVEGEVTVPVREGEIEADASDVGHEIGRGTV